MKNDNLSSILTDLVENAAPSAEINLWPAIKRAVKTSDLQSVQREQMRKKTKALSSLQYRAMLVALILFMVFAILFATPQGRAFAHKVFLFFNVTNEKSFVIPADQVQAFAVPETSTPVPAYVVPLQPVEEILQAEPTPPANLSCDPPAAQTEYFCQIKAVESQAGFDVKEFLSDPKGTEFSKVTFDAWNNQVTTEFEVSTGGGYLYLRQGVNDFVPPDDQWSKIPSDAVEQVTVNGQYAEMALGTYVVYPNATSAVWEPGGQLSLVWRDGYRWFVLEKLGDPYPIEWITKEELIKLAESLVDERPLDVALSQDPENLKSVAEAERLAGFDALTPALLPQGFELKKVAWVEDSIRLFYGPKSSRGYSLFIFMGPVENNQVGPCYECPPGTDEVVHIGKWQGWYWQGIYFTGQSAAGQPTPTPEWQADSPNWQLAWNTNSLWISMFFSPSSHGMKMNKETLVAIAESLK